ncbi:hypothetical protein LINPERHAP1_LOCUS32811 [Linum perenne]
MFTARLTKLHIS